MPTPSKPKPKLRHLTDVYAEANDHTKKLLEDKDKFKVPKGPPPAEEIFTGFKRNPAISKNATIGAIMKRRLKKATKRPATKRPASKK